MEKGIFHKVYIYIYIYTDGVNNFYLELSVYIKCRFDMEGHLVHETNDGKNIAVIGILYEIGLFPDLFLTMVNTNSFVTLSV